jgi:hypothetical protein
MSYNYRGLKSKNLKDFVFYNAFCYSCDTDVSYVYNNETLYPNYNPLTGKCNYCLKIDNGCYLQWYI